MSGSKSVAEKHGAVSTKVSFTERSTGRDNVSATRSRPAVSDGMSGTTPCKTICRNEELDSGKQGAAGADQRNYTTSDAAVQNTGRVRRGDAEGGTLRRVPPQRKGRRRIFGVTFIDHDNRLVINGSRLDRAFSANNFERLFAQAGDETRNTEKENLPDSPKIPGRIPDRHPQRSDTAGKWLLFDLLDTLLDEAAAPDPYEEYEMIQKRRKRRVQN